MSAATIFSSSTTKMLAMKPILRLPHRLESYFEGRAVGTIQLDCSTQLLCQRAHELQTERRGRTEIQPRRKSDPIVADLQGVAVLALAVEQNPDPAPLALRKRMLERIG